MLHAIYRSLTVRLILGALALGLIAATTIVSRPPAQGVSRTTTIVKLQDASLRKDQCVVVTDPTSVSDCTGGDGTDPPHICCSDGISWTAAGDGAGGGSAVFLDINDVQLSSDMNQIDVRPGDTNSIFSEPIANELHIDPAKAWPTADAVTFWAVVYPDPAEGGSTTDGVQEAIDACPAGGCIVQLDCDTTYALDIDVAADPTTLLTITADDIWVRGCGANSTTISFTGTSRGTIDVVHSLRGWHITGDRVRISDLYFLLDDACGGSSQACQGSGGLDSAILIGNVEDFRLDNARIVSKWGASATTHPGYRSIWFAGGGIGNHSQRGSVTNSVIGAMGRGLELQFADNVYVAGNTFFWDRPAAFGGAAGWQVIKYEGTGIQIIGNNFDMGTAIATQNPSMKGLALTHQFADVDVNGEYAQVIGNTFTNLTGGALTSAIAITGYKHGFIHNNLIKARRICSTERGTDCTEATQAADCDSNDCIDTEAIGISFDNGNGGTGDANKWNIITGNTFEGFDEDGTLACSIVIPNATTDQDNEENIFANNVFDSTLFDNPTTDDGVCGDAATIRANVWLQNLVTGRDEQCVIGRGVAGECILSQDFNATGGTPTVSVEGHWTFNPTSVVSGLNVGSFAGDPSTPVNGDIWYDSTANQFDCHEDGSTVACIGGGGSSTTTVNELLPSTDWVIPQTGGAQEVVFGAGGNFPRTFLNFNDEYADESIYLETHLPTGYRIGDAFTATVAWSTTATTGSNPGEQACWCLDAVDIAAGVGIDVAADETQCSDSTPTATANQRRTTLITLTQGSYVGGRALVLRLFRDEDSGDSNCEGAELTVDVRFHGLLLTYGLDL